jgi:glycosyltransferase involved in cell wall biosynthesis
MPINQPLVSVIMNCYNCDRYLKEAIDSVYEQTYQNWEIILWDNASQDRSPKIARFYDDKLKYFRAETTTLLGNARRLATEQAKGEYIAFLDCDDLWLPDKLAKQVHVFNSCNDDLGIVYGRSEIFYSDNRKSIIYKDGEELPCGMVFDKLAKEDFIPFLSAIVERKKFFKCGGFPPHLKHSTDYWIFLRLTHDYPVYAIQDVCCRNRIHTNNLSSSIALRKTGLLEGIEVLSFYLPEEAAKIGIKYNYVYLSVLYLKSFNLLKLIIILSSNNIWFFFFKYLITKIKNKLL